MYDSGEDAATSVRAYRDSLSRGARALVGPSYSSVAKNLALLGGIDQVSLWGLSYPSSSYPIQGYPILIISYPGLSCSRMYPTQGYPILSRAILSYQGLSYPIQGYPILSRAILSSDRR